MADEFSQYYGSHDMSSEMESGYWAAEPAARAESELSSIEVRVRRLEVAVFGA